MAAGASARGRALAWRTAAGPRPLSPPPPRRACAVFACGVCPTAWAGCRAASELEGPRQPAMHALHRIQVRWIRARRPPQVQLPMCSIAHALNSTHSALWFAHAAFLSWWKTWLWRRTIVDARRLLVRGCCRCRQDAACSVTFFESLQDPDLERIQKLYRNHEISAHTVPLVTCVLQ
jgi:hypothetical protein